jgi:hypothetical protein
VPSWGERDETKLFDARNSVETELSYGSKPSSTTLLGLDFLIDLSPGWLRPGAMDIRRATLLVAVGAAVIGASFFLSLTILKLLD